MLPLLAVLALLPGLSALEQGRPPRLPLPDGPLTAFSENDRSVHFIEPGSLRREGDRVELNVYTVFHPGAPSGDRVIVQWITEMRVDCGRRTVQSMRLSAYDEAGGEVLWLPTEPAERTEPGGLQDNLRQAVCETSRAAPHRPIAGWRDALQFGRARLAG